MCRRGTELLLVFALGIMALAGAEPLCNAPNPAAKAANQLVVSGNACGPTALVNAFRFGNTDWQRATLNLLGSSDKQQITAMIRQSGMRPSQSLKGQPRWSRKGVNIADLCDMANETTHGQMLPLIAQEVLFLKAEETQAQLLQRVHQRLAVSLVKGLPPLLSLRRYVRRSVEGKPPQWLVLEAHFVTIVALPKKLDHSANSFAVSYIDPWGGSLNQGIIRLPQQPLLAAAMQSSPCLEADFPQLTVGKKRLRAGEQSVLAVSAALGRW
jgi:hypothetical protein